jgi:hypothetical protein
VVRQVPALRDREIVTVFQYERLFDDYLRSALPGLDPIDAVAFAAAVTAVHNHVLRRLRGTEDIPESVLTDAYDELMHRFGVHPDGEQAQNDDVVVATFPVGCRWPRSCGACATSSERALPDRTARVRTPARP